MFINSNVSAIGTGSSVKLELTIDQDAPYENETNPMADYTSDDKETNDDAAIGTTEDISEDANTNADEQEQFQEDTSLNDTQSDNLSVNVTKSIQNQETYNKIGFVLLSVSPILLLGFLVIILVYSKKTSHQFRSS